MINAPRSEKDGNHMDTGFENLYISIIFARPAGKALEIQIIKTGATSILRYVSHKMLLKLFERNFTERTECINSPFIVGHNPLEMTFI